jgi:hypothetical protein
MASSKLIVTWLSVFIALAWLTGCGSGKSGSGGDAAETAMRGQLAEIHDLVFSFAKNHQQQPPKKLSDLQPLEKINPAGFHALKDQSIVLIYGVPPDSGSSAILAYAKDADKQGGLVLLANGDIKKASADEVKAAEKK